MSTKKVAKDFVTEHYCDICGKMISDGSWDGGGGVNFWGQYLAMKQADVREIKLETKPMSFDEGIVLNISYSFIYKYTKELCNSCADEVKNFIEKRRQDYNHD